MSDIRSIAFPFFNSMSKNGKTHMEIVSNSDKNLLVQQAALKLNNLFEQRHNKSVLFLTSGGSAIRLLDTINTDLLGNHITVAVLDERFSEDPTINNFAQLQQTGFYKKAHGRNAYFISTIPEGNEALEKLAQGFEKKIRNWKNKNSSGKVIITQGIGIDGHTAGIMPVPENPELFKRLFINTEKWIVGYDAGDKNQFPLRVTTTIPFLRDIVDHSIVYVGGEEKQKALRRVLQDEGELWETPARVLHEMKDVYLFTSSVI